MENGAAGVGALAWIVMEYIFFSIYDNINGLPLLPPTSLTRLTAYSARRLIFEDVESLGMFLKNSLLAITGCSRITKIHLFGVGADVNLFNLSENVKSFENSQI